MVYLRIPQFAAHSKNLRFWYVSESVPQTGLYSFVTISLHRLLHAIRSVSLKLPLDPLEVCTWFWFWFVGLLLKLLPVKLCPWFWFVGLLLELLFDHWPFWPCGLLLPKLCCCWLGLWFPNCWLLLLLLLLKPFWLGSSPPNMSS